LIISASYRTDIPTFYVDWFVNRVRAGYCKVVNPYNPKQHSTVSLRDADVDGFVFWTKNLKPFMGALEEIHRRNRPFLVQYTINGYPRQLESRVVDLSLSLETFKAAAAQYGSRSLVWRYDTIVLSSITNPAFHLNNFRTIASELRGWTDEVVVSFMQLYEKTRRNMDLAGRAGPFAWSDPSPDEKRSLLSKLVEIASENQLKTTICTQPDLVVDGTKEARCIDAERLMSISGKTICAIQKGNRKECGCFQSCDIGDYDTCPHGCVYCYAVRNRDLALERNRSHDPHGEYLYPPAFEIDQPPSPDPQLLMRFD
jgi:hypothetical protein